MVKISVIIPVYNVENYLAKCLDSLLNQTLQDTEIICINDGSTDNSLEILEEYAKKDDRIKIINQENSKQGAARNRGLEIATGEFVTFVDSDDWVDIDYLEKLYNAIIDSNSDIAIANSIRNYKKKTKEHLTLKNSKKYCETNEILRAIQNNLVVWGKLFKFGIIKDLRFEEGVFYEDAPYAIRAIHRAKSVVTVPDAKYHYYSNPKSTIKQKLGIKNENDKISTTLDLINYCEENNIALGDCAILKDRHLLWAVKHYKYFKDYYLFGIKIFRRNIPFDNSKVFVVFNTACFGDVLLCNSLVQNIKLAFPDSKVVFVTDKKWADVAKYQKDVDEVVVYDKKGVHKGFAGMPKFIREFPYKKPFASFVSYKNERNFVISKLLKSRFVINPINTKPDEYMQYRHSLMLQPLTNKRIKNLPLKYELPDGIKNPLSGEKYVALCCITKNPPKDMPLDTAFELINRINAETEYKVVLTGAGDLSAKYAEDLAERGADFINLVNKTSILELGAVLKDSVGLISCDTGTMHYGYALGVPTIAVFYEDKFIPIWAPQKEIYKNVVVLKDNFDIEIIMKSLEGLRLINE